MKILVITTYLGNKGGLGRYSHEMVKALRSENIQVGVLCENNHKPLYDEKNTLISVLRLTGFRKLYAFVRNVILCRIESSSYDAIQACDGWPYAVYGFLSIIGTSKQLFITGIGTYTVAPLSESGIKGWIIRKAYKRAAGIFCISDYVRDRIKQYMPDAKAETILMGTTELPVISKEQIAAYRTQFDMDKFGPVILSVGDIKDRKGQLDTLKALSLLKDKYPNFLYVLLGSTDDTVYPEKIKKFAEENNLEKNLKIISGMYDDFVLSFYYQVCDVFALNSTNDGNHFEGFGLVFLEAAQFGKPAVGSRGCGIESAICDGYSGYLTNQGDAKDIAEKIEFILTDKNQKISQNAYLFYKEFSWKKTAKAYISQYRRVQKKH